MQLTYSVKPFAKLSLTELYRILQLRQQVFVVEQDCPYLDADDKDQASIHVLGTDGKGVLHSYTRLVPLGLSYQSYVSIGRVVTSIASRRQGTGIELMQKSIAACRNTWPGMPIKISAQQYLIDFYQKFGFVPIGEGYLEDDIPHIAMVLS